MPLCRLGLLAHSRHEALIGVGYASGPLLGSAAGALASSSGDASQTRASLTLALTLACALGFGELIRRWSRPATPR